MRLAADPRGRGRTVRTARRLEAGRIEFTLRLRPGRYRLTLTARDAAGNRSAPLKLSARIAK